VRPKILDLFCGSGGCSVGYHRAGFDVVGVDNEPQPHYPFAFVKHDAIDFFRLIYNESCCWQSIMSEFKLSCFDVIHASPPCQAYSTGKNMWKGRLADDRHPDLIPVVRELLEKSGKVYVIENVVGAPLKDPMMLCGDMFGLAVKRHRLFESNAFLWHHPECRSHHPLFTVSVFGGGALSRTPKNGWTKGTGNFMQKRIHVSAEEASKAMGIEWMTRDELSQAIPSAYTEFIGRQLIALLKRGVSCEVVAS
jgi:DNA (cytosine-5)-methyltransferase 1